MQSYWLTLANRSSCILFLSGWGMDPEPFMSIPVCDHDLLIVYDYTKLDPTAIIKKVETYPYLHLVAWSMGVWIAGAFFFPFQDRFTSAMAINGTLQPVDDKCGIPATVFNEMLQTFSSSALTRFYSDMFDQPKQTARFLNSRPQRSQGSIAEELQTLLQKYEEHGPGSDIFTSRIVGSRDRIFQARSQLQSWGKENCKRIKAAHFPFYDWSGWDVLIRGDI